MSNVIPWPGQVDQDAISINFLERVLPPHGLYCACVKQGRSMAQSFHESIDSLWTTLREADRGGRDVYFAPASFSSNERTVEACAEKRSLHLDIDYGPGHQKAGYETARGRDRGAQGLLPQGRSPPADGGQERRRVSCLLAVQGSDRASEVATLRRRPQGRLPRARAARRSFADHQLGGDPSPARHVQPQALDATGGRARPRVAGRAVRLAGRASRVRGEHRRQAANQDGHPPQAVASRGLRALLGVSRSL